MSQYPSIYAGQFPDADTLQALAPMVAWKTASAAARTSTTLTIDPDLQVTLAANAAYDITADVIYAAVAGGFAWGWTVPSGAGGGYTAAYTAAGSGAGSYAYVWSSAQEAGNGNPLGIRIGGTIWTSSAGGTLGLTWAAFTSGDSVLTGAGSILRAKRIA